MTVVGMHFKPGRLWVATCALALATCQSGGTSADQTDSGTTAATDTDDTATGGSTGSGTDTDGGGGLPPIDPTICPELEFTNVVDDASCDEIQGRGLTPMPADEVEMCRRLFVDLTGALPTPADFTATCAGRSVDQIVTGLTEQDAYVTLGQRLWADIFLMTSDLTLYNYLEDLDGLVGQLYRSEIDLPAFAELATTHPGFTGRFDGQDLVGFSFIAFLGRDAAPHERVGLEPLWHMWEERYEDMHPLYFFNHTREVVNTIVCMGSNEGNCHSNLWGHQSVVLPPVIEDDYDYDGVNVFAEEDLTADQWNTLRLPGRLIAQQPTFYETAADRSMERYLGYEAGRQLPKVRQALVDMLESNNGDIVSIEREILGSQLYTMAGAWTPDENTPQVDDVPDFWHGPMKQMPAEAWLDSLEKLSGVELGHCDHRFPQVQSGQLDPNAPYETRWWHPNDYPLDDDPDLPPERNKPNYDYRNLSQALGGCPDQQAQLRFTGTGVMIAISFSSIGRAVCEAAVEGSTLHPAGTAGLGKSVAELGGVAEALIAGALTEPTPTALDDAVATAVEACRDATECDASVFVLETCSALVESAPFIFN